MSTLLLKNVKIETGFTYNADRISGTKTDEVDILIRNGKVEELGSSLDVHADEIIEGNGDLLMPSLREMHIHVDKTYFSGPWKACVPITKGILTRIEEEETLLPEQLPFALQRAENTIEWLLSQGHTHIRSHCNVDPQIGTKHIEITLEAFKKFEGMLTYDIVAFPQHGLLRSNVQALLREAMRKGATLVGGVDPSTIDRDIERSLNLTMDIAVEANAGLDLHLHNGDSLGAFEFTKFAELVKQGNKIGQATISHAIALGDLKGAALDEMIGILREAKIDVTSTVPTNRPTIPVQYLYDNGIHVSLGHDSLTDHWSPFGTGDTIEKLCILAERFRFLDEYSLNRTWKYASGGITPLNDEGERVWPQKGDAADFLLLDAVCSAQVVARRRPITRVIHQGKVVSQNEEVEFGVL
ncbi:amidohydrolase family protein [Sporosarcina sp. Sa2YVA2]|uniref:Amidohydrolase family protein n=1 Tax=Sporosarcina quadrami TaxID=2762234 RepID=A0ABR8U815_9BACL|nr:amidohydrolase [Sporosarcina quadrami]MBD7984168.1 amidohydrolase family protein [Sporosarcina quadrami]